MAVIFLLGFFLDFIEIAVVVVPIIAPILLADPQANITAVWLGVMIGVNIQTSFLTPPFGFALFYLRGVASKALSTVAIYKGVVPFIILQLIALGIVGAFPPLVNYLPNRFYLSSFNAPPPMNPRLQACVEDYLGETFALEQQSIEAAITSVANVDMSYLPKKLIGSIQSSVDSARDVFPLLEAVNSAKEVVANETLSYKDLHTEVRIIQREIGKLKGLEKRLKVEKQVAESKEDRDIIATRITEINEEVAKFESQIPSQWNSVSTEYQKHLKVLSKAQRSYRRAMDDSFNGIETAIQTIGSRPGFSSFVPILDELISKVKSLEGKAQEKAIKDASAKLNNVAGANDLKSLLSKARRAYKKGQDEKGDKLLADARAKVDDEIVWRKKAETDILPILSDYQELTANNIGLRGQERLPDFLVPRIARCRSVHEDISLNF